MKTSYQKPGYLTITVPAGANCGLYPQVPASRHYQDAIDPTKVITPTEITQQDELTVYLYKGLSAGIYHYSASMDGCTAVCQIIHYTEEAIASGLQIDVELYPLAGNGYESGFVMLNTREFIDAQLLSDSNAWGPEYAKLFRTPQFTRSKDRPGYHQQTTNEGLWDFITELHKSSENMYVFSLGKSPKYGYDMPLVLFTREDVTGKTLEQAAQIVRSNGKPTVQHTAQVHANEPASAEGALAMMLALTGDYGNRVLKDVDVYMIPRINLDGAFEVIRRSPTTGDDMNRDYLYMNNQEIRMVTGAYNLFLPEVAIDGHEKWSDFLTTGDSRCTDMELQVGAGSLNHPANMTELGMDMALNAIAKGRELGLRTHFYSMLASAAGGSAGSSYYGTRNSLSFLVETPGGTTLGRYCMERRVLAQCVLASSMIDYTVEHSQKVMHTVHASRERMVAKGSVYDPADFIVLEHDKTPTGSLPTPMIHVPTGKVTDPARELTYHEHTVALRSRVRPTAYVIPAGLANEEEILRVADNHAVPYYRIPANSEVALQQYRQTDNETELSEVCAVSFKDGAYAFPNTVPSTILSVIMEPDFNRVSGRKMTLFSMGLVTADEDGYLPIYRYCHDLTEGKLHYVEK